LTREMSGEAALDRAAQAGQCDCPSRAGANSKVASDLPAGVRKPSSGGPKGEIYAKMLEQKYLKVDRCC
jgi:hypothetical protein